MTDNKRVQCIQCLLFLQLQVNILPISLSLSTSTEVCVTHFMSCIYTPIYSFLHITSVPGNLLSRITKKTRKTIDKFRSGICRTWPSVLNTRCEWLKPQSHESFATYQVTLDQTCLHNVIPSQWACILRVHLRPRTYIQIIHMVLYLAFVDQVCMI